MPQQQQTISERRVELYRRLHSIDDELLRLTQERQLVLVDLQTLEEDAIKAEREAQS